MSILISLALLHASASMTTASASEPAATPRKESKICRDMMMSSSKLGAVRVCKTRAAWQRWQRCHSATRYCAPPTRPTVTVVSLPGDKLICKYVRVTGSRIEQQKVCGTRAQWELADRETQDQVRDIQSQSLIADEAGGLSGAPHGPQ